VTSARLCTTLENKFGVKVSTVEHLLAAIYIAGIDNVIDIDYDKSNKERKSIADSFNKRFKKENIIAQVAGETGLDIIEIGKDKQQVPDDFAEHDIMFLGCFSL
jgi:UDP-3-O-[3-hydroxymyristoyl] N-acetylglucosamine deacetylase